MNALNKLSNGVADVLLAPFVSVPLWGLVFWGAVSGIVMTFVFKRTSNQRALARVADRTCAEMLAVRLFRDDLSVTFRCQMRLLKLIAQRLWYSIPPMLVMLIPFLLVLVQLALRYETHPLAVGDQAIVQLFLAPDAWEDARDTTFEATDDVVVETPGLRDESNHSITWRVHAEQEEAAALRWQVGDAEVEKSLSVADAPQRLMVVSHRRPGQRFWDRLFHPAEAAFPAGSAVQQVDILYPHVRATSCLGINVPWWLTFMAVSIIAALIVRPFVGVQF